MPLPSSPSALPRDRRAPVLIGLVVLAIGAYQGISALRFAARTVPATGVVVSQGGSRYTVRYEVEGQRFQLESGMPTTRGFARDRVRVGSAVPVRYDPDAPADARVAGSALWFFPLAMTLIGAAGIASGLVRKRP